MIDVQENLWDILTHPITTYIAGTMTAILGVISRFEFSYVHEILGDISMSVGICACIALIRVHILRGNQISMQNKAMWEKIASKEDE